MLYCPLKNDYCEHCRKRSRTLIPLAKGRRRGNCLVCSKLPRTKNIVRVIQAYDGGSIDDCTYHKATSCPLED